jgi:hypothetical protein
VGTRWQQQFRNCIGTHRPENPVDRAHMRNEGVSLGRSTGHSPVDNSALKSLANKGPTKTATVPLVHTSAFPKPFPPLVCSNTRPLQKDIDIMRIRILGNQLPESICFFATESVK